MSPYSHSLLLTACGTLLLTCLLHGEELRTWTDKQGRQIHAEITGFANGVVRLRLATGVTVPVSLEKFSNEDVDYILSSQQPVSVNELADVRRAAERIDALIEANLAANQVAPNPALTDEQFIRRACLQIVGRIPRHEEVVEFLRDGSREKRALWIDRLLKDPGHAGHLFNYFADMLRMKHKLQNIAHMGGYADWLHESVLANKRYDQMVREMLSSKGAMADNPAVGYYVRDLSTPLDNVSLASQIFLGADLSCAQCHDDPFDEWTQKQFYEMAAFFASRRPMHAERLVPGGFSESRFNLDHYDGARWRRLALYFRTATVGVAFDQEHRLKFPEDYHYANAKPGEVALPHVPMGRQPAWEDGRDLATVFGDWLVSPDNLRFAVTIANRLWQRGFGQAVVEPVHDLKDLGNSRVPGLLPLLGVIMKAVDYDLRQFERILYNTRCWQRQASLADSPDGTPLLFAGPALQHLSASQLWDSFLTLMLPDPDYFSYRRNKWSPLFLISPGEVTPESLLKLYNKACEMTGTDHPVICKPNYWGMYGIPHLSGGEAVSFDSSASVWRCGWSVLLRSCFMIAQEDGYHELADFGMSQRFTIDGSTTVGSVPLVLNLMNSPQVSMITRKGSKLMSIIDLCRADGPKVEAAFLTILSRMPSRDERSAAYKAIRRDDENGLADVAWALINTREFLFIQ